MSPLWGREWEAQFSRQSMSPPSHCRKGWLESAAAIQRKRKFCWRSCSNSGSAYIPASFGPLGQFNYFVEVRVLRRPVRAESCSASAAWRVPPGEYRLASAAWQVSLGKCCLASVAWQVLLGKCCLAGVAWQVPFGKCRPANVACQVSLGACRPANVAWQVSLGKCRPANVAWQVALGKCRLASAANTLGQYLFENFFKWAEPEIILSNADI